MKLLFTILFAGRLVLLPLSTPANALADPAQKGAMPGKDTEIKLGQDEEGCKDSALLERAPGCNVIQCDVKPEMENVEVITGLGQDGLPGKDLKDGSAEILYYICSPRVSPGVITRHLESTLSHNGYMIIFSGKNDDDFPALSAVKGNQWIQIATYLYEGNGAYVQTALKAVQPTSAELIAEEFGKSGRVTLAVAFDQTQLSNDSEKTLAEVASFLTKQPGSKVAIEAYVAAGPAPADSEATATERAEAIAAWLAAHGVDKSRLKAKGAIDPKPVDAKTMRFELVKQ